MIRLEHINDTKMKLNQKQQKIVTIVTGKGNIQSSALYEELLKSGEDISLVTVKRALSEMVKMGVLVANGSGRSINYSLSANSSLFSFVDPKTYFEKGPDERIIKYESFNLDIFKNLENIFSQQEMIELKKKNDEYLKRVKGLSETMIKKETERLTIELSWKSSQIEGNTYSLVDTELLIKERIEAEGHNKEEAIMILNHKNVLDYIFNNREEFKKLDLFQIEKIHEMLTRGMKVKAGIRSGSVRITGTRYRPMDNQDKIRKTLLETMDLINSMPDAFSKSLIAVLMISYIQPFEDGNKRTARILANALLLANEACPLSYRSVNEGDYKKAILIFYEQNNISLFKELFITQFKFAVDNYFL